MGLPEGAGDGASVGGSVQVHPAQLWPWPVKKAHVYSPGNAACHASQFLSSWMAGHAPSAVVDCVGLAVAVVGAAVHAHPTHASSPTCASMAAHV